MNKELGHEMIYYSADGKDYTLIHYKLHYRQPAEELVEIFEYDELNPKMGFHEWNRGIFVKKKCKIYHFDKITILPEQKLYAKTVWKKENENYITYDELSKKLKVKEFIEYMKDNGMNVCPLKGD